jgi:hypothetical protein
LAIIIFFSSTVMQIQKANAAIPVAGALAAGTGAGYATVGMYVLGGLLVAGGAAALGYDHADQIKQHSTNVWNGFNDTTKTAWKTAIEQSIQAGKTTLTITDQMYLDIQNSINLIRDSTSALVREYEMRTINVIPEQRFNYYDTIRYLNTGPGMTTNKDIIYTIGGIGTAETVQVVLESLSTIRVQTIGATTQYPNSTKYFNNVTSTQYYAFYNAYNLSDFKKALGLLGLSVTMGIKASTAPAIDYFDNSVTQALQGLSGLKEINIPLDNFLAKNPSTGSNLSWDGTNLKNADGTIFTGTPAWEYPQPAPKVGVTTTVNAPAIPINDVYVGDTDVPFVSSPTTTTPPTTGDTDGGILQGLWDWLKGILQDILNALLSLASLIGIIDLLNSIKNTIDSWKNNPTQKVDWTKLKLAAGTLTTVFPFSIPWDVYNLFSVFNVSPVAPNFQIDINRTVTIFNHDIPIKYKFNIDFSTFDPIAAIGRWGLILVFDIAIIMALRRLTPD